MRVPVLILVLSLLPALAAADETRVSGQGALGVGAFGQSPATTVDVGMDMEVGELALGLGGRLRFLTTGGFRSEDWDSAAEGARILRYATYRHAGEPDALSWAAALGPLANARMGSGAVVNGFTAGLDVDHGTSGFHGRLAAPGFDAELLIDGITEPWLFAGRGGWTVFDGLTAGLTLAVDRNAPDGTGDEDALGILAIDGAWTPWPRPDGWVPTFHFDAVSVVGITEGVHLGSRMRYFIERERYVDVGAELRYGTPGYVPGWVSPLYQLERVQFGLENAAPGQSQLAEARAGGPGGLGAHFEVTLVDHRFGEATLAYDARGGARDVASGRFLLPRFQSAQLGAWFLAEKRAPGEDGPPWTGVLAVELRVRLPRSLFVSGELGRLYRTTETPMSAPALEPLWIANLSVGAVLGE